MSPRPLEFEDLTTTSVTLERYLIEEAKKSGINISEVCREALAKAIKSPEVKRKIELRDKFKMVPKMRMRRIRRMVEQADNKIQAIEKWTNWINDKFDLGITLEELQEYL